ncbi:MAG: LLM class F420-dependent oxidoreductase [Actinomycetota bacterium]
MKFGLTGVNAGRRVLGDHAIELARAAEKAGFESLWTVEHVVVPSGYASRYPYSEDGKMPGREGLPIGDPLAWIAFAAGATSTIKFGTGILILPQRNPVLLAKECATIDSLSGGRLLLGIGVGWLQEEFDALGIPFQDRAARTDEYVEALRILWSEPEPTFHGKFCSFENAVSYPKPANGTIPIIVGGHSEAAAKRAGRIGNGFFPWGVEYDDLIHLIEVMRTTATQHDRDPDSIEITAGALDPDTMMRCADLGVARIVTAALARTPDDLAAWFDSFKSNVMSRLS